jgi:hypothetical protein
MLPHHRPTTTVSPCSPLLAQHAPRVPLLLEPTTFSRVSHRATAASYATVLAMGMVTTPSARKRRVPLAWAAWPYCGHGPS